MRIKGREEDGEREGLIETNYEDSKSSSFTHLKKAFKSLKRKANNKNSFKATSDQDTCLMNKEPQDKHEWSSDKQSYSSFKRCTPLNQQNSLLSEDDENQSNNDFSLNCNKIKRKEGNKKTNGGKKIKKKKSAKKTAKRVGTKTWRGIKTGCNFLWTGFKSMSPALGVWDLSLDVVGVFKDWKRKEWRNDDLMGNIDRN